MCPLGLTALKSYAHAWVIPNTHKATAIIRRFALLVVLLNNICFIYCSYLIVTQFINVSNCYLYSLNTIYKGM